MSKANKDFQQQMQTLTHEFQERFIYEQKAEWDKLPFTSAAINDKFPIYREFGLMYETPVSLNITPAYFVLLMHGEKTEYNVSDMVSLCQAFERRTFFQYMSIVGGKQESRQQFADFLSCMEQLTNEINAIVEPIKDKLIRKMQALQQLQAKNGNRSIALS